MAAYLADVNVLIALIHGRHAFSPDAAAWISTVESASAVGLPRVTIAGAARILTNPRAMREERLQAPAFWAALEVLFGDARFLAVEEPAGLDRAWREVTEARQSDPITTDDYLLAFSISAGRRLVTFDRDLGRRAGDAVVLPLGP